MTSFCNEPLHSPPHTLSGVNEVVRLESAPSLIRLLRQAEHDLQELGILLADEQPVIHKALERGHCSTILVRGGTNDRNGGKLLVEEVGWLGHDEVGLQGVAFEGLGIGLSLSVCEGCKRNRRASSTWSIVDIRQWESIPCLILPGLKVHGLAGADAKQDP
jgi:hypothetical protein